MTKRVITKAYPDEIGMTDGVRTYCASATPCYLVTYDDYSGYFPVSDCTIIDESDDCCNVPNCKSCYE